MSLYRIDNSQELKEGMVRQVLEGWRKEAPEVCLLSQDGSKVYIQRSLLLLHSPFLTSLLRSLPQSPGPVILSLPLNNSSLTTLIKLLAEGETGPGSATLAQVREASQLLGVSLGSLSSLLPDPAKDQRPLQLGKKVQEKVKKVLQRVSQGPKRLESKARSPVAPSSSQARTLKSLTPSRTELLLAEERGLETLAKLVTESLPFEDKNQKIETQSNTSKVLAKSSQSKPSQPKLSQHKPSAVSVKQEFNAFFPEHNSIAGSTTAPPSKTQGSNKTTSGVQGKGRMSRPMAFSRPQTGSAFTKQKSFRQSQGKVQVKREPGVGGIKKASHLPTVIQKPSQLQMAKNVKTTGQLAVPKTKVLEKNQPQVLKKTTKNQPDVLNKTTKNQASIKKSHKKKVPHPQVKTEKASHSQTPSQALAPDNKKTSDDVAIEYEEMEESKCPYCMKQFTTWNAVSRHMANAHKDEV